MAYLGRQKSVESFFFHNFAVSDNESHHIRPCPMLYDGLAMHAGCLAHGGIMMIICFRYIFLT